MLHATRSFSILAISMLACIPLARADEPLPTAEDLIGRVSQALNPPRSSKRDVEIVTDVPDSAPVAWQGRQLRKSIGGGRRTLTLLASPPSVAGFAILVSESSAQNDTTWMYVPPVRRVRQIVYPGRYEYFLGTDLSSADFGFFRFDPSVKVAGKVQVDGKEAWLLEEEPDPKPGGYSRIRTWISTENDLPLRRDYYDGAGKLWKEQTWADVQIIDTVPTALTMSARSVQEGSRTVMRFSNVDYDVDLGDQGFEPETLASVSLAPTSNGTVAAPP